MSIVIAGPQGITVIIETPSLPVLMDPPTDDGGGTTDPGTGGGGTTDPGTGGGTGGGGAVDSSARTLAYTQDVPSTKWTIRHGANTAPAVTVLNTAGVEVLVRTRHDTGNGIVYIEPDFAFAGRAFLRWNTTT